MGRCDNGCGSMFLRVLNIQQISYIPFTEHFGLMLFHLDMGNVTIT